MALLTDRQQRNLLIALGLTDFATRSRLSTAAFDAIIATAKRFGPTAARAAPRVGMTALSVGKQIALRHPVLTAGAVVYYTYKNREEIGDLVEQGYEIIQPVVAPVVQPIQRGISEVMQITEPGRAELAESIGGRRLPVPAIFRPRKASAFNKAVSAGMKAVKGSTSYGKKGVIKPAKKAFALVVKLASAKKKKKKAPKSGIRRRIWNAMKGLR
jgi:hypothetical protein